MKYLVIIATALIWAQSAAALVIDTDRTWAGQLSFAEDVQVLPGVTLTVVPGTVVHFVGAGVEVAGALVASGAEFSGEEWKGLVLKGSDGTTRLSNSLIKGAKTGLVVQGGAPHLEGLSIIANTVGIELRGKAAGRVSNTRFIDNSKVGLFVKDESTTDITACQFEGNARYAAYLYRARPRSFRENTFVANGTALMVAYHGSDPEIEGNRFEQNEVGILVDRAARPVVKDNLLRRNQTGLHAYRRSDPLVTGNRFEHNALAILVAYSSYPEITANDFVANDMALKLEYQSSAWETERGARARAGESATRTAFAGQGMRHVTEDDRKARRLDGTVDAKNNWWGVKGTQELQQNGGQGNPSFILDGHDQATFVDEGVSYPLDKVSHQPWSPRPLTGRRE